MLADLQSALHGKTTSLRVIVAVTEGSPDVVTLAWQMLGRLVSEEIQRLPAPPPHTICHTCGMHDGSPNLPIAGVYSCCVYCHFGTIEREEARTRYREDFAANDRTFAQSETEAQYFARKGQGTVD